MTDFRWNMPFPVFPGSCSTTKSHSKVWFQTHIVPDKVGRSTLRSTAFPESLSQSCLSAIRGDSHRCSVCSGVLLLLVLFWAQGLGYVLNSACIRHLWKPRCNHSVKLKLISVTVKENVHDHCHQVITFKVKGCRGNANSFGLCSVTAVRD